MARKRPCPISSRKMTCIHSSSNINVDNSISDIAKKIVGDMTPVERLGTLDMNQ